MRFSSACVTGAFLLLSDVRPASACGGCFHPQAEDSVVVGHRMAFAVSEARTVLWDQFEYTGSPEDFSWVLPIAPGAVLEEASPEWLTSLDAVTSARIEPPDLRCAQDSSGGCAFGSDEGSSLTAAFSDEPGVTVLRRETVGPYETVTLRSNAGDELSAWLVESGYAIPPDIEPVIAEYVSEGADFIALRLQPGRTVQQMTPVRVVTPGGDSILPLRMVAAGTGPFVDIVLFVIAESRQAMPDLQDMVIDPKSLTWDFSTDRSNYDLFRERALEQHGGRTHLTTFAEPSPFGRSLSELRGVATLGVSDAGFGEGAANLTEFYFRSHGVSCSPPYEALGDTTVVTEERAGVFTCDTADDLSAALIGMRPSDVWLTRLEMRLPREALDRDCVVEPNPDTEPVSARLQVERGVNRPCPAPIFTSRLAPGSDRVPTPAWVTTLVLAALLGRRSRGRRDR